jgi:hypothetical protein
MSRWLALGLVPLLVGCDGLWTWVSQDDVDDRLMEIDNDGDGVSAAAGDCDDSDATFSPDLTENWYDGLDQDCSGDAGEPDFDADGDLYFHSTVNDWLTDQGQEIKGDNELDCDDGVALINPNADDAWYDGIDSNCQSDDDYDQDGDSYQALGEIDSGDDCDDTNADVFPLATDTWYDGVDSDCDGADDYDQDGDGHPHESINSNADTALHVPIEDLDCNDEAAGINPSATENWYDGVDSDCDGADDYDQDGDGVQLGLGLEIEDCDDENPAAAPGNIEILNDGVDRDCDGNAGTFSGTAIGVTWENPRSPAWAENTDRVYLSVIVDAVDFAGTPKYDTSIAPYWDSADPTTGVQQAVHWFTAADSPDNTYTVTRGQAFMVDDTYIYGVIGLLTSGTTRSMRLTRFDPATTQRKIAQDSINAPEDYDSVTMVLDDADTFHVLGCDATNGLHYLVATKDSLASSTTESDGQISGSFTACDAVLRDGSTPGLDTGDTGGGGDQYVQVEWHDEAASALVVNAYDSAQLSPSLVELSSDGTSQPADIDLLTADDGGVVEATTLPSSGIIQVKKGASTQQITTAPVALSADLAIDNATGLLFVGWVDTVGNVHVAWGTTDTGFNSQTSMTVDFPADEIAVWVPLVGNTLMVSASNATNVAVGIANLN